MTTTNIHQGLSTENKPSSRVLAPPGGGSSNIFGYDDSAERRPPQDRNQNTAAPVAHHQPPQQQQRPQQQQQKNRGEAPYASFAECGTNSTPSQFNQGGSGSQNDKDFRCYSVSAYRDAAEQKALTKQRARGQASGAYNILTNQDHETSSQSQFQDYERSQAQAAQQFHDRQQQQQQQQQQARRQASSGNRTRGAYNPITGEDYPVAYGQNEEKHEETKEETKEEAKEEQKEEATTEQQVAEKPAAPAQPEPDTNPYNKPHTSTRVRQPPGGASSKLW